MWEHHIHARVCNETAGAELPFHYPVTRSPRDRGVDRSLVNTWEVALDANVFPAAATGTTTAFVRSHAKRRAVIVLFISVLAYSTATRIAASADELSASLLNSCYELAAGSIAACSDAISSGKLNGLDLAKAYVSRGLARQRSKEDDNAISDFNEAIRINPSNTQAFNARGNSYLSLGQYDRAIEDYRQAIELNPKFVPRVGRL